MIVLDLPTPPSANNLFFTRKGGRSRSPEYVTWITAAGWHIQTAHQKPLEGPVSVSMLVEENGRRDLDGYWKPVLDLLVAHRLIPDDRNKIVRQLLAEWSPRAKGVRVTVVPACVPDNPNDAGPPDAP